MTTAPDAPSLLAAYDALSHRAGAQGDLRLAQLAAWAGDVHALEALLWESGVEQAPDPAAELAAVGESVAAAIDDLALRLPEGPLSARAVVEAAREALIQTFDESVHGLLQDRLQDLAGLDECRPVAGPDRQARAAARLGGRDAETLAADLRTTAGDCARAAALLAAEGEPEAARRLAAQAEAAAFEGYLVGAALAAGDDALVTVDLRWELASGAAAVPAHLTALVGTAERDALSRALAPEHR